MLFGLVIFISQFHLVFMEGVIFVVDYWFLPFVVWVGVLMAFASQCLLLRVNFLSFFCNVSI